MKKDKYPQGFYQAVKSALNDAEEKAGEPVHNVDIYRSLIEMGLTEEKPTGMRDMLFCLFDMVRNDEVLVDDEMSRYTMSASL